MSSAIRSTEGGIASSANAPAVSPANAAVASTNSAAAALSPRDRPVIAIDGPAGAGKSTMAAHLARRFGFLNLETGAMYRALALKAIDHDLGFEDEAELLELAGRTRIALKPRIEGNCVLLDGVDVSRRVRDADVTAAASRVSVHPRLRAWMVEQQRRLGEQGGVVMEGRDIGTVVFPDAEVKIFLDAAPEVRGNRRYRQVAPGENAAQPAITEEALLRELKERDERDRNRAESPLRPAPDAVILDSTGMTLDQVLQAAETVVRKVYRGNAAG
jgi:cytidylate kinase